MKKKIEKMIMNLLIVNQDIIKPLPTSPIMPGIITDLANGGVHVRWPLCIRLPTC